MIIQHDNSALNERGDHPNYVPYDGFKGKLLSFSPTGRLYTCVECDRQFASREAREDHRCTPRWASPERELAS